MKLRIGAVSGSLLLAALAVTLVGLVAAGSAGARADDDGGAKAVGARGDDGPNGPPVRLDPALTRKKIGRRFRLLVESAGLAGLAEADQARVDWRTIYEVWDGDRLLGRDFVGRPVYLERPGDYTVTVGDRRSLRLTARFVPPAGLSEADMASSWRRARAVDLVLEDQSVPVLSTLMVVHPRDVGGAHADGFEVRAAGAPVFVAAGNAVAYDPPEVLEVDAGVAWADTVVHLLPGRYELDVNGFTGTFDVGRGERTVVRTGALWIESDDREARTVAVHQALPSGWGRERRLALGEMELVLPGRYRFEDGSVVEVSDRTVSHRVTRAAPRSPSPAPGREVVVGVNGSAGADGFAVTGTVAGSPAARAGLVARDRIVRAGGRPVASIDDLAVAIDAAREGGRPLLLDVHRGGRVIRLEVTLGGEGGEDR